jgi:hypothetical protein
MNDLFCRIGSGSDSAGIANGREDIRSESDEAVLVYILAWEGRKAADAGAGSPRFASRRFLNLRDGLDLKVRTPYWEVQQSDRESFVQVDQIWK